jgi:hypothetical protein
MPVQPVLDRGQQMIDLGRCTTSETQSVIHHRFSLNASFVTYNGIRVYIPTFQAGDFLLKRV